MSIYYRLKPFQVEKVRFYVCGSSQLHFGFFAPFYRLLSKFTGRVELELRLVALTDQQTAGNPTEMEKMWRYGKRYLKEAQHWAQAEGYLVTKAYWGGIIDPNNLEVLKRDSRWKIWEFNRPRT